MKQYILFSGIFCFFFLTNLAGQGEYNPKYNNDSKGVVYNKEFTIDIRTHTNGFLALAANFGTIKTYYKTKYYHFEIGEIKHNKEYRTRDFSNSNISRASSAFIYGKQNNFYVLRAGIGTKKYLTEKALRKGLAVGINYEYGPSLGIIKPYYIDLNISDNSSSTRSIRYSEEEAANFLNYNSIAGSSGFTKGLNEVSFTPGINGKFGIHFDWGAFDEFVKAVEVGVMADIYFRTIPIMVDNAEYVLSTSIPPTTLDITPSAVRNRPFFVNLYISLQLGKRR